METIEHIVRSYGYLATAVGSFLEGETILLVAAMLAHEGYLQLPGVILVATLGAFLGDLVTYWGGRWKSNALLRNFGVLRRHMPRAMRFIERHGTLGIFIMRFSYGLRATTGVVYGIAGMAPARFVLLAALSCSVWALIIGSIGYLFGQAAAVLMGHIAHYEKILAVALLAAGAIIWTIRMHLAKTNRRGKHEPPQMAIAQKRDLNSKTDS